MNKYIIIRMFVVFVMVVYMARLAALQLFNKSYQGIAINNTISKKNEQPCRGLIKDRNNKTIAYNVPVYDLSISAKDLKRINLNDLCEDLKLSNSTIQKYYDRAKKKFFNQPTTLVSNISVEEWGFLQEKINKYRGLRVDVRSKRVLASKALNHVLGYLKKVDQKTVNTIHDYDYTVEDLVGASGLETIYESRLRGVPGVSYKVVNAYGIEQSNYNHGQYDLKSINGQDLHTSLDLELQNYAHKLLEGKTGSIVAIEPETGEVLVMASCPTYEISSVYSLFDDVNASYLNRAIMSTYPPGSVFKLINTLFGLMTKKIDYFSVFPCAGAIKCHNHPPILELKKALQYSCNPYFMHVFFRLLQNSNAQNFAKTFDDWSKFVKSFVLGEKLGIDLPFENSGLIPNAVFYDKIYGKNKWNISRIRSLGIGQGELLITPLQLANIGAIIANRGYCFLPHIGKTIGDMPLATKKIELNIDREYFEFLLNAMQAAVEFGSCQRAFLNGIEVCGKTGTSQNNSEQDHSVCITIAPKQCPKIVVSVYIENAGWGARAAASIASLITEQYLKGRIFRKNLEKYVLAGDFS